MFILIHKFILFVFGSLNERESASLENSGRERKRLVVVILVLKMINFSVQLFHLTRGVGWF
jgi:hypothetical protein